MAEPVACAKKYLILLSFSWCLLDEEINGINERRFISKVTHIKSQDVEKNVNKVLRPIVKENIIVNGKSIKKEGI